jgi:Oxaloacetate decarboxylase, gamma chain.
MKIDINAFMDSLPIMGVGLLGIFIVTIVIIAGIYLLKAITAKSAVADTSAGKDTSAEANKEKADSSSEKESAMDLLKEREKKDFLETEDTYFISRDL